MPSGSCRRSGPQLPRGNREAALGESVIAIARTEKPGIVSVPRWFAELMAKARYRGMMLEWEAADFTLPDSLDRAFAGLANVAQKAVEHGVERLIIISQAGVTRPVMTSVRKAVWGFWSTGAGEKPRAHTWGSKLHEATSWNTLKQKRLGELAAMCACDESAHATSYTIIRAATLAESIREDQEAWRVSAASIKTLVGDNLDDLKDPPPSISRGALAASAVEAIFASAAVNKVVEATSSARALTEARDSALDKSAAHRGTQAEEDTRPSSASPAMEQLQHLKTGSELGEGRQTKEKVRAGSKEKEVSNEKEEEKKEESAWERLFSMHRPAVGGHEAEVKAAARAELKAQVVPQGICNTDSQFCPPGIVESY